MLEYEIKDGFNDVEYCFLITANPIDTESNAMSEEDLNKRRMGKERRKTYFSYYQP